jgi:hypothetical protein
MAGGLQQPKAALINWKSNTSRICAENQGGQTGSLTPSKIKLRTLLSVEGTWGAGQLIRVSARLR